MTRNLRIYGAVLALLGGILPMGCGDDDPAPAPGRAIAASSNPALTTTMIPELVLLDGEPLVIYYDGAAAALYAAYPEGASWTTELVAGGGAESTLGPYLAAVTGPNGKVHIAARDDAAQNVLYLSGRPGTGWTQESPLPPGEQRGDGLDIAVDLGGNPYIAYRNATTQALEVAYKTGGNWSSETVDGEGNTGHWPAIATDLGGRPNIAYQNLSDGSVRLARFESAGNWLLSTAVAPESGVAGGWLSMALRAGSSENLSLAFPRLVYLREAGSTYTLEYAEPATEGEWVTQRVEPGLFGGSDTCIAVGSDGTAFVSYLDNLNADLKVGSFKGRRWRTWTEDAAGVTGFWSACAVDAEGLFHVAYARKDTGQLLYKVVRDRF